MAESGCICEVVKLRKDTLFQVRPHSTASTNNDRAVVFIHGFGGNAGKTWKAASADDSFPCLLACDPELSDHDFYLFEI